ncbi:MAG: SDR family oxidoreductase [Rhizonema sp. PD38]|nr:SDR family oxidoreductase [Rhizonema sp. PD38]
MRRSWLGKYHSPISHPFKGLPKVVEQQMINSVAMRRLGSLEEVANGVAFLMSDEASYMTGFNLEVTGGI